MCLAQGHNAAPTVRLDGEATPRSPDKHSTTALLHTLSMGLFILYFKGSQVEVF